MMYLLAQVTPETEAVRLFESWWLIVAAVFPFVFPFVVKAGAQRWVKLGLSIGLSVAVSLITLLPQLDGQPLTLELLFQWATQFVGVVQVVYQVADQAANAISYDREDGLNGAKIYRPWKGLGKEETAGPGDRRAA